MDHHRGIYLVCALYLMLLANVGEALPHSRLNRLNRKFDCKDNYPRRYEDLPQVVVHGQVDQVYYTENGTDYKASIKVERVIKGAKTIEGTTIIVTGFNSSSTPQGQCQSNVTPKDTWIYLLDQAGDKVYQLNGTLLAMNLNNLDRINALAAKEPYKRRGPIIELPCETHYCPFNGDCIELDSQPKCVCPTSCDSSQLEVCGSNNKTYSNECTMRADSCIRKEQVFVKRLGKC